MEKKYIVICFFVVAVIVALGSGRLRVSGEAKSGSKFDVSFKSGGSNGWKAMRIDAFGTWCSFQVSHKDLRNLDKDESKNKNREVKQPRRTFERQGLEEE